MKLLILGGTIFLGRHLVNAALRRGHDVTIFHRGKHVVEFPGVTALKGDRDGDLSALAKGSWDAVIDTCGYVPRVVAKSVDELKDRSNLYCFISTISVYADFTRIGVKETDAVGTIEDESNEDAATNYGSLKALCEQVVEKAIPDRTLIIRPGLIVGAYDPTGRFSYWPHRIARGGVALAPAPAKRLVQFIDAVDLAEWAINMLEGKRTGVFNATGPGYPLTLSDVLDECRRVLNHDTSICWVDEAFLDAQGVEFWTELPLCISSKKQPEMSGLATVDCSRAIAEGLRFRSLAETIQDAYNSSEVNDKHRALRPEREAELLRIFSTVVT